jgi:hypothetical protein
MEQLADAEHDVVTMCPICLFNLEKAAADRGVAVKDISECLLKAYGD